MIMAACTLAYLGTCDGFSPVSPAFGSHSRMPFLRRGCATIMDRTNVQLAAQQPSRCAARQVSLCMSDPKEGAEEGAGGFPFLESNAGEGVFKFQFLVEATKRIGTGVIFKENLGTDVIFNDAQGTDNPEEVFLKSDYDGSGGLDFDEFSAAFGGLGMGLGYASMRELFDDIDLNADGIISLSEFKTRMEKDLAEAQNVATAAAAAVTAEEVTASAVADSDGLRLRLEELRSELKLAETRAEEISFAIASIP